MKSTTLSILTLSIFAFTLSATAQNRMTSLNDTFALIDADANGKISLEEFKTSKLKTLKPEVAEKKAGNIEKRFALLDTNSDGIIDKEEFLSKKKGKPKH